MLNESISKSFFCQPLREILVSQVLQYSVANHRTRIEVYTVVAFVMLTLTLNSIQSFIVFFLPQGKQGLIKFRYPRSSYKL